MTEKVFCCYFLQEIGFSASASCHGFDSIEGSIGREKFPDLNGVTKDLIGRQDSTGSQDCSCGSNNSSFTSRGSGSGNHFHKQREDFVRDSHPAATLLLQNTASSKDLKMLQKLQLIYLGQKPGCGNKMLGN